MYKSILVPIDLNEVDVSDKAIKIATQMAEESNAKIRLVNVQQTVVISYMEFIPPDYEEEQRNWANGELEKIAKKIGLQDKQISYQVRVGGIYHQILAEADEWGADLIVIGSHRPAMATYLLGSNAKTVVRHAKCSVLVVRD